MAKLLPLRLADADHAVHVDAIARHFLDRDDVGVLLERAIGVDHLREAAGLVLHQHVRQQQRERLVADQFARAPHRVAQAQRRLLAGEARGARRSGRSLDSSFEVGELVALLQRQFELELAVEMILDHRLVAAGHEDEMLDAGLARLVHHVLDQRPVDHRQHLLGHGLGGGQEAGAEPGHGKDGFANRFHARMRCRRWRSSHGRLAGVHIEQSELFQ